MVALEVPPLRRRREDIAPLVHGYLERFSLQLGRAGLQLRRDTLEALESHDWPGNVRELINVMERAVLLCRGTVITPVDLPGAVVRPAAAGASAIVADQGGDDGLRVPEDWLALGLPDFRRRVAGAAETEYLSSLLERSQGRIGVAAELAGVDPRSLFDRLRKHGIRKEDFR